MEKETGIPTISALSAMIEALETMGLKNLVLISPYKDEMHHAEEKLLEENGFRVIKSRSMAIESGLEFAMVSPGEIYRFCRKNWDEKADGLFISCMNFNAMPCIGPLEKDMGKPVLSSHSATLWKILKEVKVRESIPEFGRLLAEGF
jgi:maleate isomerase